MALVIEMDSEMEARLRREAERRGVDASTLVTEMIARQFAAGEPASPLLRTLSPEEWQRRTHTWAARDDADLPRLPDEALSREGIYQDHP